MANFDLNYSLYLKEVKTFLKFKKLNGSYSGFINKKLQFSYKNKYSLY